MWCDSFWSLSSSRTLTINEKAIDIFVVTSNIFFSRKRVAWKSLVLVLSATKEMMFKTFSLLFFIVFIINILYTVAETGKKFSAGPNYTTLICLNIQYHLKYANIQILHEKLFLMNGKGRKCPKCLTIKINFFLIKKKRNRKADTLFSQKKI